jgi:hypothetical protein
MKKNEGANWSKKYWNYAYEYGIERIFLKKGLESKKTSLWNKLNKFQFGLSYHRMHTLP